jgi:cell division protein FtsW (lipid II flippase)
MINCTSIISSDRNRSMDLEDAIFTTTPFFFFFFFFFPLVTPKHYSLVLLLLLFLLLLLLCTLLELFKSNKGSSGQKSWATRCKLTQDPQTLPNP